ncbi:MAG: hypothetical protein EVA89_37345 [Sandaracinaceae bacterium]|nr:MAG: hypothetical protein EVA89_37345 [Sandaracinaceae bacterium]
MAACIGAVFGWPSRSAPHALAEHSAFPGVDASCDACSSPPSPCSPSRSRRPPRPRTSASVRGPTSGRSCCRRSRGRSRRRRLRRRRPPRGVAPGRGSWRRSRRSAATYARPATSITAWSGSAPARTTGTAR